MSNARKITMYGSASCSYCMAARMLLKKKGLNYVEVLVTNGDGKREEMITRSGRRTVPQLFIDEQSIGGFDELYALEQNGELNRLLGAQD